MRRLVLFALVLSLLAALTACAGMTSPDTKETTERPAVTTASATRETEPETLPTVREMALDDVFADRELTAQLFDDPDFDIHDYDEKTILSHSELAEYCRENCSVEDFLQWEDTERSSCFSAAAYSPIFRTLAVEFRRNGSVYYYYDLSPEVAEEFFAADSLGRYYNQNIKGSYDCERIS